MNYELAEEKNCFNKKISRQFKRKKPKPSFKKTLYFTCVFQSSKVKIFVTMSRHKKQIKDFFTDNVL